MARKIQFKRGPKSRLGKLSPAEMAFTDDEKKLYVGDGNENIRLLDQKDKTEITTQLADTVKEVNGVRPTNGKVTLPIPQIDTTNLRTKTEKLKLEDLSPETLSAIEGGEGTSFNLLSIPQDKSVTPDKTTFLTETKKLYDHTKLIVDKSPGGFVVGTSKIDDLIVGNTSGGIYAVSDIIELEPGKYTTNLKTNYRTDFDVWSKTTKLYLGAKPYTTNADGTFSFTITESCVTRILFKYSSYTNGDYQRYVLVKGDTINVNYGIKLKDVLLDDGSINENHLNPSSRSKLNGDTWYKGKKLSTYGDSITAMEFWQPHVIKFFGIGSHSNRGIGGTTFFNNGSTTTVDSNGGYVPTGGITINSWLCADQRIATIPQDSDIVLVMGGTNDMGVSCPIGALNRNTGLTDSDFKNAVALTIKKLIARLPNARIIFMTPIGGRNGGNENSDFQSNYVGTTTDYANAMIEVCQYYSIPCIDINGESGISTLTHTKYLQDIVHPNNVDGGKAIAQTVIRGMKRFEPIAL